MLAYNQINHYDNKDTWWINSTIKDSLSFMIDVIIQFWTIHRSWLIPSFILFTFKLTWTVSNFWFELIPVLNWSYLFLQDETVLRKIEEVRLLESRKSARLVNLDTDFSRLADVIISENKNKQKSKAIEVPRSEYVQIAG